MIRAAAAGPGRRPAPRTQAELGALFAALGDPKRLAVVNALRRRPHRAGELAEMLGTPPAALSRHLRILRRSGLVVEGALDQDARVRVYQLSPAGIAALRRWVEQLETMWSDQLRAFQAHAERAVTSQRGPR